MPKYYELLRDRPTIFPSPAIIRPGKPLIIVEGEFDALLLGQALGDLASVVTLGSASSRPNAGSLSVMLTAPVWFIATDADPAGDKSAEGWPARAVRVKPPVGKDWGEAYRAGVDLAQWWRDRLAGIESAPAAGNVQTRPALKEESDNALGSAFSLDGFGRPSDEAVETQRHQDQCPDCHSIDLFRATHYRKCNRCKKDWRVFDRSPIGKLPDSTDTDSEQGQSGPVYRFKQLTLPLS
jgi:hypothetical protein